MTRKRKNRFRMKLLSIMLAVSMLAGSLSTSAFAAADEKTETIVTAEVTADVTETGETTEAEGTTVEQPADAVQLSGGVTEVLSPTEADTKQETEEASPEEPAGAESPEEASPEEPAGAESPEEASPEEPAGAESPEEASPEEPAGAESPEEASPKEPDKSEAPEAISTYATVEEFMDAIAAFGDITDEAENEAALDNCDSIYARLSPEDQAAMAEYQKALEAYRANPNEGVETSDYVTYRSTITLYAGDGAPTGVRMNVGDHYQGYWYVKSISTSEVTFGSTRGEHNNSFLVPRPEQIWTGVSSDSNTKVTYCSAFSHDVMAGSNGLVLFTGGSATYANVINTPSVTPSNPYVTVVHEYYTNGAFDDSWEENVEVSGYYAYANNYYKATYNGNTYPNKSYDTYMISINGSGYQGTFTLTYNRTIQTTKYNYRLTWDYNGGTLTVDGQKYGSRFMDVNNQTASTYTFYEDAAGYGYPKPTRAGYTFIGWIYSGSGSFTVSNGQINMTGVPNGTATGTLTAQWRQNVVPNPAISVTKTVNGATERKPGDTVNFVIRVKNTGNMDFRKVDVSDTLPAGLTYKSATGYPMTTTPSIVWVLQSLPAGEERVFVVSATVDADATGTLTNNVVAKGQTENGDEPQDNAKASVTVKTEPGLTGIAKTLESVSVNGTAVEPANGPTVEKGDSITLTYKITVTGDEGANYNVTDEDATLVAGTWSGTLGASGQAVLTLAKTVVATEAGVLTVTNKAYVKPGDNTKPIPDDPSNPKDPEKGHPSNEVVTEITVNDPVVTPTPGTPELTIVKTVDRTEAVVGDTITYKITVKNNGNTTATNVFIKDVLDSKLEWKSAGYSWTAPHVPSSTDDPDMIYSNDAGTKSYSGQPAEGKYEIVHEMRPGAELTLTITATAKTAGTVKNTATVDSEETNPEPSGEVTTEIKNPDPGVEPTPTPTPTPGVEPTPTPTPTPGVEPTPTPTPTPGVEPTPTPTPTPGVEPTPGPGVEPTPGPGGEPTPGPGAEPTPGPGEDPAPGPGVDPAPGPGVDPAPEPEGPEAEEPEPEGPVTATVVQIPVGGGPVTPAVTPVEPTAVTPEGPEAEPEDEAEPEELDENENPLAAPAEPEEEDAVIPVAEMELEDEETPLAGGRGSHWALVNFALMNLAVFESLMLLIGYFVNTKKEKDEEDEEKKLKKKGILRLSSLLVAIISIIAFCLTEDITLPTGFVDRWTILMAIIAIVQTVVVALSRKKEEDEEEKARA